MEATDKLISILSNITKRHFSSSFSKLVLFQQDKQQEDATIRHYDIECEAAQALFDTLATKVKAIKFKTFYQMKFFRKDSQYTKRRMRTQNSSFTHNLTLNGYYGRQNHDKSVLSFLRPPQTTRNGNTHHSRYNFDTRQILSEIDSSMSQLVKKMKYLKSKIQIKGQQQDPQDYCLTTKIQKRQQLMSKLTEIGNNLHELSQDDLSMNNNNKSKMSYSNVVYKYQPMTMRNSKTSRDINKTFCVLRRNASRIAGNDLI